jgi:hypothetical protein
MGRFSQYTPARAWLAMTDVIGAKARKDCDRPHVAQKPEAILSTHLTQASISSGNRDATPIASGDT